MLWALGLLPGFAFSCAPSRTVPVPASGGARLPSPSAASAEAPSSRPQTSPASATAGTAAVPSTPPIRPELEAYLSLADLYLRAGKLSEAAEELKAAARLAPDSPEPQRGQAALYRKADYLDREIEALEKALRLDPADQESALRLSEIYRGLVWLDDAERCLNLAAQVPTEKPHVLTAQASLALLRRDFPALEQAAQEGCRRFPKNPDFYTILAEADRLQGRQKSVEANLRQALFFAATPEAQAAIYNRLAYLLVSSPVMARLPDAEEAAQQAVQRLPDSAEAHFWLGRALHLQGKMEEATVHYRVAAQKDVQCESVAMQLGQIYLVSSDTARRSEGKRLLLLYEAAEKNNRAYGKALSNLKAHPRDPEAHRQMALWYEKLQRHPQAIVELRRALQLAPGDKNTRRRLVTALESHGRITEAKQETK
jgi:tetratricopeptide (TPR) repeat protein